MINENEIITIDGEWWIPGENEKYIGKLKIIPNVMASLEAEYEKEGDTKKNIDEKILRFYRCSPCVVPQKIPILWGRSCFGKLTLLGCLVRKQVVKEEVENKEKIVIEANVSGVVSGKYLESSEDLKFKTLILDYEYCLKDVGLGEAFEEVEWRDYKIFLNNKNIKIDYKEEQNFFNFFEILDPVRVILSFLGRYPCYPSSITGITVNGVEVRILYLYNIEYNEKRIFTNFGRILKDLYLYNNEKEIFTNFRKILKDKGVVKIIKNFLDSKDLYLLFYIYFEVLEELYSGKCKPNYNYVFEQLFKIIEYYVTQGKKGYGIENVMRIFLQEVQCFLNCMDKLKFTMDKLKFTLETILSKKYRYFTLRENFLWVEGDISFNKDEFINNVANMRNYFIHLNEEKLNMLLKNNQKKEEKKEELEKLNAYEELVMKIYSITLRLRILVEIILIKLLSEKIGLDLGEIAEIIEKLLSNY
jgi:hypothetical protein